MLMDKSLFLQEKKEVIKVKNNCIFLIKGGVFFSGHTDSHNMDILFPGWPGMEEKVAYMTKWITTDSIHIH